VGIFPFWSSGKFFRSLSAQGKECVSLGGEVADYVASVGRNNQGPEPGGDGHRLHDI
jgi:hypothetical protein